MKPEFLFKGAGKRVHLDPPEGVHVQWAPKGSYRLENMEAMIARLPTRVKSLVFEQKTWAIYSLDDYSVHLQDEVMILYIYYKPRSSITKSYKILQYVLAYTTDFVIF